jgi:simple sugar transport system permease protein
MLPVIWPEARLPLSALIAPLCAILIFVLMFKTTLGFSLRAVGANDRGARYAGIQVPRTIITTMLISGALAGMAGAVEILGIQHRLWETFLIGYGYDGIAVALVGQLHPFGVLLTAIFFGALRAGANAMQVLVRVPVPLVDIIQSLTILFAVAGTAIRIRPRSRASRSCGPADPAPGTVLAGQ